MGVLGYRSTLLDGGVFFNRRATPKSTDFFALLCKYIKN